MTGVLHCEVRSEGAKQADATSTPFIRSLALFLWSLGTFRLLGLLCARPRAERWFDRAEQKLERAERWFERAERWLERAERWFEHAERWLERAEQFGPLMERSGLRVGRWRNGQMVKLANGQIKTGAARGLI